MTETAFDQAVELIKRALQEPNGPMRYMLLEEAVRLHREFMEPPPAHKLDVAHDEGRAGRV